MPNRRQTLRDEVQELIVAWVLELADSYDNASESMKQLIEESPPPDEEWETLLNSIFGAIEHRLPEKRVYLGDSSQRNAVNDANREGWNAYREAVKSILKGE